MSQCVSMRHKHSGVACTCVCVARHQCSTPPACVRRPRESRACGARATCRPRPRPHCHLICACMQGQRRRVGVATRMTRCNSGARTGWWRADHAQRAATCASAPAPWLPVTVIRGRHCCWGGVDGSPACALPAASAHASGRAARPAAGEAHERAVCVNVCTCRTRACGDQVVNCAHMPRTSTARSRSTSVLAVTLLPAHFFQTLIQSSWQAPIMPIVSLCA
jgi:hypothetical protein